MRESIPMRLIADSGSTKTAWALVGSDGRMHQSFRTGGINPVLLSDGDITSLLATELTPHLAGETPRAVCFYGAGCRPDQRERMQRHLSVATGCTDVFVGSDLLGACRALCGHEMGVCCILGTGSASCLYDGRDIVGQTPSLGYVIGDEGSGTALGRRLLGDVFKAQLPEAVCQSFLSQTGLTVSSAIEKVYRQPWPNRFMASFTPFLAENIGVPEIEALVTDEFRRFLQRNVKAYGHPELPVGFVGSIAHYFRPQLEQALRTEGMRLGRIEASPLQGIVNYHFFKFRK